MTKGDNQEGTNPDLDLSGVQFPEGQPKKGKSQAQNILLLAGGFIAVIILGLVVSHQVTPSGGSDANDPLKIVGQVALSEQELRDVVNARQLTVYWAGPMAGAKYSLISVAAAGQSFLRYLPNGTGLADKSGNFRVIATYRKSNALAVTKRIGAKPGNFGFMTSDGNSAYFSTSKPTNVIVGLKGVGYQIEIYDPNSKLALGLATQGQIQKIN
ncbi:MAG TPA: hypothetical protein VF307_06990 [Candidatus Nanopelagicaceae bacterium]